MSHPITRYDVAELKAAFNSVSDKKDWKAPIHAVVDATENLHLIKEAVVWFTATVPTFDILSVTEDGTKILVRADGYRNGPSGDY